MLGDVLAQDEVATHVEVHHLVPGLDRVVFGGRAPGRAGIVDQNVHITHALQGFIGQAPQVSLLRAVGGDPARIDAGGLQVGCGLFQIRRLARAQHDPGAGLAQRMRQLQAQPARATGDKSRLAGEVKQLLDGAGHVIVSWVE